MNDKWAHVTVKVPPGCYIVDAWEWRNPGRTPVHETMIVAKCDETVCVNLLPDRWVFLQKANIAVRNRIGRRSAAINDLLVPMIKEKGQPLETKIVDCMIKEADADAKIHLEMVLRE